jgi:hypothetical protein
MYNKQFYILSILYNQQYEHESHIQPHKIRRSYGVLRRADLPHLPRDCLFLIRKDIGRSWQRFHRRKRRLGASLEGLRVWVGEGGVSERDSESQMMSNNIRA